MRCLGRGVGGVRPDSIGFEVESRFFFLFSLFSFRDGHLPMPIRYPICYMGLWSFVM